MHLPTDLYIGGTLNRSAAAKLRATVLEEGGWQVRAPRMRRPHSPDRAARGEAPLLHVQQGMERDAPFPRSRAFCQRHGLTYRVEWTVVDAAGGTVRRAAMWRPGLSAEAERPAPDPEDLGAPYRTVGPLVIL